MLMKPVAFSVTAPVPLVNTPPLLTLTVADESDPAPTVIPPAPVMVKDDPAPFTVSEPLSVATASSTIVRLVAVTTAPVLMLSCALLDALVARLIAPSVPLLPLLKVTLPVFPLFPTFSVPALRLDPEYVTDTVPFPEVPAFTALPPVETSEPTETISELPPLIESAPVVVSAEPPPVR